MKKYSIYLILIICICCIGGYYFYSQSFKKNHEVKINTTPIISDPSSKEDIIPHSILDQTQAPVISPVVIDKPKKVKLKSTSKSKQKSNISKPKMAIIIDDIAYPSQLKSLHKLGLKITPSFFPYNQNNKFTPEMAQNEPFYIVHLPMEALHFYQSAQKWLKVGESKSDIDAYIRQIKQDFPRLEFINNHTGSKFTQSYPDMKNFIDVLNKYGIEFIDSRTTPQTKAPEIYKKLHKPLLSRQVFLDNIEDVNAIIKQLKEAVRIAKKDGYVIAIGHPHQKTFEALRQFKNTLLNEVELVYVGDIYQYVKQRYNKK